MGKEGSRSRTRFALRRKKYAKRWWIAASRKANEELWRLPSNKSIREQVRSSRVADLKNSTGRAMGASGAAAFIEEFIESNTKWLHLDIAGTAFRTEPKHRYGGTGVPVNTLYHYIKEQ